MLSADEDRKSRSELHDLITTVNLTKKQGRIRRTPKFRFRAIVRTVINNLKWLTEESVAEQKVSLKYPKLSTENKGLLRTPVAERTPEEKEMLFRLMGYLQCFDRYPAKVRESLTASAMFAYFPPGRVLVAEGHPSVAMYFIISGQANVSKLTFDPGMKEFKSVDLTVMNAGDAFGEINILHDEPWPTTVTTTTHTEILTVMKENFKSILEEFLGEQQREITKCLNQFAYFKDWNHRTIVECCILARVVKFNNEDLIVGDNSGSSSHSYFVVSGSCQVIYHLQIQYIPRKNFTELKIIEPNSSSLDDSFPSSDTLRNVERPRRREIRNPLVTGLIVDKLLQQLVYDLPYTESRQLEKGGNPEGKTHSHFFQIAKLLPGACFGIGEALDKKFILGSSNPVTLLCIPKFFLKNNNPGNIWGRVREFFNLTYPTPQAIFSQFLMHRRWKKSRTKYLESLIKLDRPFTGLTSAEAPYYARLTEDLENPIFRRFSEIQTEKDKK